MVGEYHVTTPDGTIVHLCSRHAKEKLISRETTDSDHEQFCYKVGTGELMEFGGMNPVELFDRYDMVISREFAGPTLVFEESLSSAQISKIKFELNIDWQVTQVTRRKLVEMIRPYMK